MYPTSANFNRRVRESGARKTVADIYFDGALVAENLAVSGGSIRVELDGQVRRSGNITIADPRLVPTLSNILSPLGAEMLIRQGVVYPNGTEELVPLGMFRLEVTSWGETDRVPKMQLFDRSKAMYADLPSPHSRSGWSAQAVVVAFIEWLIPSLAPLSPTSIFDSGIADYRIPGGHVFDASNHWDPIVELCQNMGGRLYFDVDGSPRCKTIANLSGLSVPVATVDAGERGVLVTADKSYSREGVYNSVNVRGAASTNGNVPKASAYNLDPGSPLRYGGPFGRTGITIDDSTLTTSTQCLRRAQAELARYTGLSYSLDFSAIPNPALDVGDVVKFVYPDGRSELHELSTLTIPLGVGEFAGSSKGVFLNG